MTQARSFTIAAVLMLAGCAHDQDGYPSLAPRAVERGGFAEPETPPPAAPATDPALDGRVAALNGRLDAAAAAFAKEQGQAEAAARRARGAPAGSEPWLDAQTALAELDAARVDLSAVATDAEALAVARGQTLAQPYPALETLRARAARQLTQAAAAISAIGASLAPA